MDVGRSEMLTTWSKCLLSSTYRIYDFFSSTGIWTQGLVLDRQVLYYLSHSTNQWFTPILCSWYSWDERHSPPCPAFFCWDGVSKTFFLGLVWNHLISASWVIWDDRQVPPYPAVGWDGGLTNYLPGLTSNPILPISASQVGRIAGVSHCAPKLLFSFAFDQVLSFHPGSIRSWFFYFGFSSSWNYSCEPPGLAHLLYLNPKFKKKKSWGEGWFNGRALA
jgi:hypothetical protein